MITFYLAFLFVILHLTSMYIFYTNVGIFFFCLENNCDKRVQHNIFYFCQEKKNDYLSAVTYIKKIILAPVACNTLIGCIRSRVSSRDFVSIVKSLFFFFFFNNTGTIYDAAGCRIRRQSCVQSLHFTQ